MIDARDLEMTLGSVSPGLAYAIQSGMGPSQYYENIRSFIGSGADRNSALAAMNEYGISFDDVMAATGNSLDAIYPVGLLSQPAAPEPVYTPPAPVYVEPEPVYVEPEPIYVPPAPVYVPPAIVEPPSVYVAPAPVYVPPTEDIPQVVEDRYFGGPDTSLLAPVEPVYVEPSLLSPAPEPEPAPAPAPAPAPTPAPAPATGKVKGRDYLLSDYENLKYEIGNQTNILGVKHNASFSKSQDEIIDDMAKQLASYGVSSLKDLTQNVYTVEERDPNYFDDGEAPIVTVEKKDVINSKTGEVIPLNKLNNSAGSGFTWYNIDFVDGQAVPYAWKEATGAGALGDQIQNVVAIPPVAAALTAVTAGALLPGAKEIATSILPETATKYAINTTANALANAGATATVVSAATGDVGTGLKAGATTLLSAGINELKGQGMDALEDLTGLDLSQPSTGSLLDTGMGDTTDQTFISAPTPVTDMPTVTVTAPPSLLDTALAPVVNTLLPDTTQTVTVTAPQEENVIPSIPAVLPLETPTVTVIGERPTTDLVSPIIPGLIDAGTVEVIGPKIPTVEVIGTQPTTTDLVAPVIPGLLDTITVTSPPTVAPPVMETSETVTPTVTVTATPPTVVDAVAPVVTTTALPETTPETPPETPFTPVIPNIPVEVQQEAQRMGYVPYGSVSYEPLLSLLAPQLMTLPYASAYRRGLL